MSQVLLQRRGFVGEPLVSGLRLGNRSFVELSGARIRMKLWSRSFLVTGAVLGLALMLSACAPGPDTAGVTPRLVATEEPVAMPALATAIPTTTLAEEPVITKREIRLTLPLRASPERVTVSTPDPVVGEVPEELLAAILEDAETRAAAEDEDLAVVRAEAVTWNDGSLGCPQPGVMYTQALVDGYWVVLEVGGEEFDYRAAASGFFTLCERGLPLPATTPGSDAGRPSE